MKRAMMMSPEDNVVTALADFEVGDSAAVVSKSQDLVRELSVLGPIPFGHKLALGRIEKGAHIIKYGEVIGVASLDIEQGHHVHVHNVDSTRISMPKAVREGEG
jgi:altronate dehydratase small subunit